MELNELELAEISAGSHEALKYGTLALGTVSAFGVVSTFRGIYKIFSSDTTVGEKCSGVVGVAFGFPMAICGTIATFCLAVTGCCLEADRVENNEKNRKSGNN